jgi:hypothetical protein
MKKRGQITFFIIIGIAIVFIIFFGILYKESISNLLSDLNLVKSEKVPQEAKSVQEFVMNCIETTTLEGLDLMGRQGGYVKIPEDEVPIGSANIFSNKLSYIDGFDTKYWFYQKDNEIDVKEIPTIAFLENELSGYIKNNLFGCIDNFSVFEDYNLKYRNIDVDADIKDDRVIINVDMPVSGKKGDVEFRFYKFSKEIKSSFGKLYELARKIAEMEEAEAFFEEKTLDIMQLYDEVPMTDISFDCAPLLWSYEKVKEDFKKILFENIQFFKVKGTNYSLGEENRNYFEWDVTNQNYKGVTVNFLFDESWPFYLDVAPTENGVMRSEQITDVAGEFSNALKSLYCLNNYHFVYDVKYPILVSLNEGDDVLQFGMLVVVKDNQPRKVEITTEPIPEFDIRFCNNKQYTSTVYTYELRDNELVPLEDVNIRYKCITHNCGIGKSVMISDEAYIIEKFPLCLNGVLVGEKEGYNSDSQIISSNSEFVTNLILEPFVKKKVKVYVDREDLNVQDGEPFENERIIIELENNDKNYKTVILYPDTKEVELLEGEYHARMYIITEGSEITLKGRKIEKCIDIPEKGVLGLFGKKEQKCFKTEIPDVSLSNLISGETEFDFYVGDDDLKYDFIRFYIKQKKVPTNIEDLQQMNFKTEPILPVFLDE